MFDPGSQNADNGLQNYTAPSPAREATPVFERAFRLICPWTKSLASEHNSFPGAHRLITELLGNRAKYGAIHGWRFGRRNPPQWAKDILASHLRKTSEEYLRVAALLTKEKTGD